jgi:predicted acyl esterase
MGLLVVALGISQVCTASSDVDPSPWPGGSWTPDALQYGMMVEKSVPITMDDGATLYADVGYPTDRLTGKRVRGTFPVLLEQDPYDIPGTSNSAIFPHEFFVSRGYIFVVSQVRGTGRTTGPNGGKVYNHLFGPRDAQDGVELVNWAAHKLDGSNGVVGLFGCSFLGITQIFTAAAVGPFSPVKAMIPACASYGYDLWFSGGMRAESAVLGSLGPANAIFGASNFFANATHTKWLAKQIRKGHELAYNGRYWQERTTANVAAQIVQNGIPVLQWTGWNAPEMPDAFDLYSIFQNAAAGQPPFGPMTSDQPVTGRYQIVVEPGGHGYGLDETLMLEWYDQWLKGQHTGIDKTSTPMHLYEKQSNRWVNAARVPMVGTYTPFYVDANGALTATVPAAGQDTVSWQLPTEQGSTLAYTSDPLGQAKTIAGPIAATVWASSNNSNMELIAALYDVDPSGSATQIAVGALIGSMKAVNANNSWLDANGFMVHPDHPFTDDVYLIPGQVERFDIKLSPIVWSVAAGHSIRLVISTQAGPDHCGVHAGFGPFWPCGLTDPQQRTLPGGIYEVQRGGTMATMINVPLMAPSSLPTARSGTTSTSRHQTQPLDWGSDSGS